MGGGTSTGSDSSRPPGSRRVAIIDAYPLQIGGAHRATADFIAALGGSDWTGLVISPAAGPAVSWLGDRGVDVVVVPAPRALMRYGGRLRGVSALLAVLALPGYWRRLRRELRDADLLWINDLRALWLAGPAARLARRPAVWQLHSSQPQYRWSSRLARLFCQHIVVPSRTAGLDLLPAGTSFDVLPNMVAGLPLAVPAATSTVVTVARLLPVKGLDVLLRACGVLRDRGIDHQLTIVGGTQPGYEAYASELSQLSESLGLSTVTFAGELAEPLPVVSDAAVYVQPSRHESFGLAALEAMAMGVPVVVSRTGGLADLVSDRETGLVVAPEDPAALAAALAVLLGDAALRRSLGDAGRLAAQERYGPERYRSNVLSLLGSAARS